MEDADYCMFATVEGNYWRSTPSFSDLQQNGVFYPEKVTLVLVVFFITEEKCFAIMRMQLHRLSFNKWQGYFCSCSSLAHDSMLLICCWQYVTMCYNELYCSICKVYWIFFFLTNFSGIIYQFSYTHKHIWWTESNWILCTLTHNTCIITISPQ